MNSTSKERNHKPMTPCTGAESGLRPGEPAYRVNPKKNNRGRDLRKRTTSALLEPKTCSSCGGKQEAQKHEETRGGEVQNWKSMSRSNTAGEALLLARDRAIKAAGVGRSLRTGDQKSSSAQVRAGTEPSSANTDGKCRKQWRPFNLQQKTRA
jgi:hypothetical protein